MLKILLTVGNVDLKLRTTYTDNFNSSFIFCENIYDLCKGYWDISEKTCFFQCQKTFFFLVLFIKFLNVLLWRIPIDYLKSFPKHWRKRRINKDIINSMCSFHPWKTWMIKMGINFVDDYDIMTLCNDTDCMLFVKKLILTVKVLLWYGHIVTMTTWCYDDRHLFLLTCWCLNKAAHAMKWSFCLFIWLHSLT